MSLFPLSDEHSEDDGPKMHRVAFAAFFLGDESDLKGIHWKWSRECGYVQSAVSRQEKTTQNSCRSTWTLWFMTPGVISVKSRGCADSIVLRDIWTPHLYLFSRGVLCTIMCSIIPDWVWSRRSDNPLHSCLLSHAIFVQISLLWIFILYFFLLKFRNWDFSRCCVLL